MKKLFICLAMILSGCSCGAKGGMPDYCYVIAQPYNSVPKNYFSLYGHRKWDNDIRIATYESLDEAVSAAKKLECPFRY